MAEPTLRHHLGIWLTLLALLGLSIASAFLELGEAKAFVTLSIAVIQAFLIVTFFMYMRKAAPVPRIAAASGFIWLLIMMGLILTDYRTRPEDMMLGRLLPEPAWESPPQGAVPTPLAKNRDYGNPAAIQPTPDSERGEGAPSKPDTSAGERVYRSVCIACHGQGLMGAPRAGDQAAWEARSKAGMETLVSHAVNGYQAMPPKGGHPELSEQDIRGAIGHMLSASGISIPVRGDRQD